jgi:hypothetical protein
MEHLIKCEGNSSVSVSEFDGGVWISIHRVGAYTSTPMTREQAVELRNALTQMMETEDAAQ